MSALYIGKFQVLPNLMSLTTSKFVANLHPGITELMLYDKFSTVGPVRLVNIGRDLETHQRLGYAYVYFHKAEHGNLIEVDNNISNAFSSSPS